MIDGAGITTAREQIARADVLAADMFDKMLLVAPFVAVFTRDERVHILDVMDCFSARNKE